MEDFCAGVKILLERMDTHPEEFTPEDLSDIPNTRWGQVINNINHRSREAQHSGDRKSVYLPFLSDAEVGALNAKYTLLRRKAFDEYVMQNLLVGQESKPRYVIRDPYISTQQAATPYIMTSIV